MIFPLMQINLNPGVIAFVISTGSSHLDLYFDEVSREPVEIFVIRRVTHVRWTLNPDLQWKISSITIVTHVKIRMFRKICMSKRKNRVL